MMNDELEGLLDEMDEFIRRAIDAETTSQTIEMLTGMTIEQVVEGFRDGTFEPKQELPVVPKWFHEWWKDIPKGGGNLFYNIDRFQDELFSFETREAYDYITDPDNKKKLLDIIVNELDYEVEHKPLYYALIKGHELVHDYDIYWNCDKYDNDVFVSRLHPPHDNFTTELTKEDWNELGINDSNADFVRVDGVRE